MQSFAATINPCKAVHHINGRHTITVNGDSAEGIAYCVATLVNDVDGTVSFEELFSKLIPPAL